MNFGYSFAGAFVGFLVGLTGVGGGSLMAPILILFFGFQPAVAIGSDLWFAAVTKSVGGGVHRQVGSPNWKIAGRLALGSVPAAVLTLLWLGYARGGHLEAHFLLKLLGAALIFSACLLPLKGRLETTFKTLRSHLGDSMRSHQFALTILGGAAVGCLVTLTSVGAGALVAVLLMMLYPLSLKARALVGTDIVHAVPLALVAAVGHSIFGNVDWSLLGMLLLGSIPGIIAGSLVAGKVNDDLVRIALSVMLAISGAKLLLA
ncbi:sulfite exporter TauE/SafE family protein [Novosphingobium soli]|uniref:Probable membrane transporter protein n=1 Tax=Novosphingobium soli TaxID=574956 RepID=A0ABV6CW99_9SPHN